MLTAAALLVAAVAWLEEDAARRLGAAGVAALALGIAAGRVPGGTSAPPTFLAINAGLQLLGVAVCLAALLRGDVGKARARLAGPVLGVAGAVLAGSTLVPL